MAETIVSDKKNRSVPKKHERERVCVCVFVIEKENPHSMLL